MRCCTCNEHCVGPAKRCIQSPGDFTRQFHQQQLQNCRPQQCSNYRGTGDYPSTAVVDPMQYRARRSASVSYPLLLLSSTTGSQRHLNFSQFHVRIVVSTLLQLLVNSLRRTPSSTSFFLPTTQIIWIRCSHTVLQQAERTHALT